MNGDLLLHLLLQSYLILHLHHPLLLNNLTILLLLAKQSNFLKL
jgi:hypothetical protein